MPITTALSQFYGVGKTIIGAAQKTEEKPKESFAKMVDDVCIMKIKPKPNWVRYTVKLPYEESERYVIIKPMPDECFSLSISTIVPCDKDCALPLTPNALIPCKLQKTENSYEVISKFSYFTTNYNYTDLEGKDKNILRSILKPLSQAEEEPEYEKMIDTALESLR